eukprot:TRINITY_DN45597_c0_g1_i1.p1 TRINITY_DN45597_c0_g1~~TRINITY_DN45597_c0_g1_i1.p1  ORF type:complete len:203 (-),score=37.40 TRINITY_DN45597_c0_g1_i1:85-693(-)
MCIRDRPVSESSGGLAAGCTVTYVPTGELVVILQAHSDDVMGGYYTVQMPDGREKQTTAENLSETPPATIGVVATSFPPSSGSPRSTASTGPSPAAPEGDPVGSIAYPSMGVAGASVVSPPNPADFQTIGLTAPAASTPSAPPASAVSAVPFEYPNVVYPKLSQPTALPGCCLGIEGTKGCEGSTVGCDLSLIHISEPTRPY